MQVGTKELKNRLSHYLRSVRSGESIQVTDRGVVVAVVSPPPRASGDEADDAALDALEAEGILTRGTGAVAAFNPLRGRKRARLSHMIIEDRG